MEDEGKRNFIHDYVPLLVKDFIFVEFLNDDERNMLLYSYVAKPKVKKKIDRLLKQKHGRNIHLSSLRRPHESVLEISASEEGSDDKDVFYDALEDYKGKESKEPKH